MAKRNNHNDVGSKDWITYIVLRINTSYNEIKSKYDKNTHVLSINGNKLRNFRIKCIKNQDTYKGLFDTTELRALPDIFKVTLSMAQFLIEEAPFSFDRKKYEDNLSLCDIYLSTLENINPYMAYELVLAIIESHDEKIRTESKESVSKKYLPMSNFLEGIEEPLRTHFTVNGHVTMSDVQREHFYKEAEKHYPGFSEKFKARYKNYYRCKSPNSKKLWNLFVETCEKEGITYDMRAANMLIRQRYDTPQMSMFEDF